MQHSFDHAGGALAPYNPIAPYNPKTMSQPSPDETKRSAKRLFATLVAVVGLALASAAPALAQSDPTSAQYENSIAQVDQSGGGGESAPPAASQPALQQDIVGGLPFTGLDVVALAAVALALTSVGFALRRVTKVGAEHS